MKSCLIPRSDHFAGARARRDRGLIESHALFLLRIQVQGSRELPILYSPRAEKFGVHALFGREETSQEAQAQGITNAIASAILSTLHWVCRWDAATDTAQNVKSNYNCDYFARIGQDRIVTS